MNIDNIFNNIIIMKKLFTMLVASVCCTMAYAQTISVKDVSVAKGGTGQVEVSIANPTNYTAFQFDLKLPAGVSVKKDGAALKGTYEGDTRKLEWKLFNESTNTYRFLSYDMGNAALKADGNVVAAISIEVAETAETGDMTGGEMLVVTSDGTGTATETATGKITVSEGEKVSITSAKQAIICRDKNLDFSNVSGVDAYIVTGYDKSTGKIWLTRVKDVPAGTAVLLMGEEGDYNVPVLSESKNIYDNMLVGSLEGTTVSKDGIEGMTTYILSSGDNGIGFYLAKASGSVIKAGGGYLPLPTTIDAVGTAGNKEVISMNKYGMLCYCSDQSLDFSGIDDLKAYTAFGYDKKGTIRLTRAKRVPANTAMLLYAPAEKKDYEVPTASLQQVYSNMFEGTLTGTTIQKEESGKINYYVSVVDEVVGFYLASASGTAIPAKRGWLPVPKEMTQFAGAATRGGTSMNSLSLSTTDDVITLDLFSSFADGTTGISRIAAEDGNDTWYNLSGQRISTPTKKGLYIKNGKKVIVK